MLGAALAGCGGGAASDAGREARMGTPAASASGPATASPQNGAPASPQAGSTQAASPQAGAPAKAPTLAPGPNGLTPSSSARSSRRTRPWR